MYKIINEKLVQRLSDGAFVPISPDNRDYANYLAWLALGNTATPADPPPPADTRREQVLESLQEIIDDTAMPARLRKLAQALKRIFT